MKQISLKSGYLDKFKSFYKRTELFFPDDCSLTLFSGDNKLEPRLGANGAGKSTLFDALCFCLYGSSINGMRIGDLVSYGEKVTSVGFTFLIDDREVSIGRSGPPNRIYVDGKVVEQADIDKLIGMSRQRFLNSVLYGQAAPLFVDLSIPERGVFLDELLDLQFWMRASDKAGKTHKTISSDIAKLKIEIGRTEGSLSSLESVEELTQKENTWQATQDKRIEDLITEFEQREMNLNSIVIPDKETVDNSLKEMRELCDELFLKSTRIENEISNDEKDSRNLEKAIKFFDDNQVCPTCSQPITRDFVHKHTDEQRFDLAILNDRIEKLTTSSKAVKEELAIQRKLLQDAVETQEREKGARAQLIAQVDIEKHMLDQLEHQITALGEEENPYTKRREQVEATRAIFEEKFVQQKVEETNLNNKLGQYDFWREAFKRVRLYCIKTVLQQLDIEVMNAASSLGLIGWKIQFTTETETKSGTIKTGVQIKVESPTMPGPFSAWSGGEGQRVRLCVSLGLASLIQRWTGVRWDVEIFDEPTTWLSEAGISDLLDLLKSRTEIQQKRIFIIDHRGLQHSGLDHVITVTKGAEGSYVV